MSVGIAVAVVAVAPAQVCAGGHGEAWQGLRFGEVAFQEIVDLAEGQHLGAKIPDRAWVAAASGALRALRPRTELYPALAFARARLTPAGRSLLDGTALKLGSCPALNGTAVLLRHDRPVPRPTTLAGLKAQRVARTALKEQMRTAWRSARFRQPEFACVMSHVQTAIDERRPAGEPATLPAGVTPTATMQRSYDAWRIAATFLLQALDPHCNLYPNKLFEAQEQGAIKTRPTLGTLVGDGRRRVGVIRLQQFATGSAKRTLAAIARMQSEAAAIRIKRRPARLQGLVLDMRGNTGGWVEEAVAIADGLLAKGVIVSIHSRHDPVKTHRAKAEKSDISLPVVVVVDAGCRSACELLAAALQENHRAVIVGGVTYGKGSVQGLFDAAAGPWSLLITIARYHGPLGNTIQVRGVKPDLLHPKLGAIATWRESDFAAPLPALTGGGEHKTKLLTDKVRRCVGELSDTPIASAVRLARCM